MMKRLLVSLLLSFLIISNVSISVFAHANKSLTNEKMNVQKTKEDKVSKEQIQKHDNILKQIKPKLLQNNSNKLKSIEDLQKKKAKFNANILYSYEKEPNDDLKSATVYEIGNYMHGYLDVYDIDYYSFRVKYDAEIMLDISSDYAAEYFLGIFNSKGEIVGALQKEFGYDELYTINVKPGTYYMALVEEYDFYTYPYTFTMYYNYNTRFLDVPQSHWAYNPIENLASKGIINGYEDGTFKPNNNLTRAQAASMIVNATGIDYKDKTSKFKDVPSNHWASAHIAAAKDAGILNGYGDRFKPNDNVTRAQIAVMVSKAFNLKNEGSKSNFRDVPSSHWANKYIEILASNKIVSGYENNTFKPNNSTTRAQFSKILSNAMEIK